MARVNIHFEVREPEDAIARGYVNLPGDGWVEIGGLEAEGVPISAARDVAAHTMRLVRAVVGATRAIAICSRTHAALYEAMGARVLRKGVPYRTEDDWIVELPALPRCPSPNCPRSPIGELMAATG